MNKSNVVADLGNAILTVEAVIAKLKNKEEICISDIESNLYEWRGSLYKETNGNHPLFGDEYSVTCYDNNLQRVEFRFVWPSDAIDVIKSIFISEGVVYASSADTGQLKAYPVWAGGYMTGKMKYRTPTGEHTVAIDKLNVKTQAIQASKTNLRKVEK